jgi:hypothetical protein
LKFGVSSLSTISFSQSSSSAIIKNKKVDEVKAQLVNFQINQGYEIENETNNTISFTKKASKTDFCESIFPINCLPTYFENKETCMVLMGR